MKNYYFTLALSIIFMLNISSNCVAQNATLALNPSSNNGGLAAQALSKSGNGQFEENKNQWDARVLYKTDFQGVRVFLEKDRFTCVVNRSSDLKSVREHLSA